MCENNRHGFVTATFNVYEDCFNYKSGVYNYVRGNKIGAHAIKIIGWEEMEINSSNVKYWIAVNSWTNTWGDNGFYNILKGSNECEIENGVVAGLSIFKESKDGFYEKM
jgi:cathepsin B